MGPLLTVRFNTVSSFRWQIVLKSQKIQLTFSQTASAALLYDYRVASANRVPHLSFPRRGLEDKHMPLFEPSFRLRKVPHRTPKHRGILTESSTMHESSIRLVSGGPDFVLVKGHDLTEGDSRFEDLQH